MQGKKTIVTGGNSGIGRAVAAMFAMEGADVSGFGPIISLLARCLTGPLTLLMLGRPLFTYQRSSAMLRQPDP